MPNVAAIRCCTTCGAIYRTAYQRCPGDGGAIELVETDPLLGTTLGLYAIDALIGEGGMSRVYVAHHTRLQHRKVAIKVLLGDFAADLEMRMRFAHEAELASRMVHPNIVAVVDYGVTDRGQTFLAMEYVDGPTLSDIIADEGPLPVERVLSIGRALCKGLAHAHEQGLVHRDFKPDNVLVVTTPVETPRIADFGLAITPDDDQSARLTSDGIALGTPSYAAPEQTHGDVVDYRADLFALGITLYEMATGKLPYDSDGAFDAMRRNATGRPPSVAERTEGVVQVPAALDNLMRRLLSRKPDDRPSSALEVLAELDQIDPSLPPAVEVVTLEPAPAIPARVPYRHVAYLGFAAVAAIAIVGVTALIVGRNTPSSSQSATWATAQREELGAGASRAGSANAVPALPAIPTATTTIVTTTTTTIAPPAPVAPDSVTSPPGSDGGRGALQRRRPAPVPVSRSSTSVTTSIIAPATAPASPDVPDASLVTRPPVQLKVPLAPKVDPPPPVLAPAPHSARLVLGKLAVRGALSESVIRRGIDRALPAIQTCYVQTATRTKQRGNATVRVAFQIDDTRRASAVRSAASWNDLAPCVTAALESVRTSEAPDVGTVGVALDIAITGVP